MGGIVKDLRAQVRDLQNENGDLKGQLAKERADKEYIAMMTDVELESVEVE